MKDLHHSCQGESHILINKVCQDSSFSTTNDTMSIAIVCDGHGGARYFRSDVGSRFAVEASKECVEAFVKEVDSSLFQGKPFTPRQAITSEVNAKVLTKETSTDKAFRQLFASIIYAWRTKIERHAQSTPLSDEEKGSISPKYQDEFLNGIGIEKTYGCTLMCYVYTSKFWFAFHIGDGKCIAFDTAGKWSEPIPWDERCFLNKTTSLCDSTAIDEFRYCYCGDGTAPLAVFLGSDGIDDSFGKTENMVNFYIQVLKLIANEGEENAYKNIEETLPQLSKIGSKDDMSIACIYDELELPNSVKHLICWQKGYLEDDIYAINHRILDLQERLNKYKGKEINSQKELIDFQYAEKELPKAFEQKKSLAAKWNKFAKELYADNFVPYHDEIGFGDNMGVDNINSNESNEEV